MEDNKDYNALLMQLVMRISSLEQVLIRHKILEASELASQYMENVENFQRIQELTNKESNEKDSEI